MSDLKLSPHRRYDPLSDRWLLVSPQRTQRPWEGERDAAPSSQPAYSEQCYLCPGNRRANGECNPDYQGVWIFDNDFPALLNNEHTDVGQGPPNDPLFQQGAVRGRCRVICYSPRHDLSMSQLPVDSIAAVIDAWIDETRSLHEDFLWVQIFENRGAAMGCSNPHPHGQIWALDSLPSEAMVEDRTQRDYWETQGVPMLLRYAGQELEQGERVVYANEHWLVVVPYWATWPFETLLLPRDPVPWFGAVDTPSSLALAEALSHLLRGYDQLFDTPFPYSMGWHGAPGGESSEYWQLHAHFYPPLLRSASVRKFMVGFEMLSEAQRDLTPEAAAQMLRAVIGQWS